MGSKKHRNRQHDIISEMDRKKTLHEFAESSSLLPVADKIICRFPTKNKLSKAVMEIARPIVNEVPSFDEKKILWGLAVLAWNMALSPPDSIPDELTEYVDPIIKKDPEFGASVMIILMRMIESKLEIYPDDQRVVSDYQCIMLNGNLDFQVASILPEEILDDLENHRDLKEL